MEVFPLEDAPQGEVAGQPVSQVEQIKSWDVSFAQLEKMLQAACEIEQSPESSFPNQLSPTLATHNERERCDSPNTKENKRRRNSSESAISDCFQKVKHFRTDKILSADVTLTLIGTSKKNSVVSNCLPLEPVLKETGNDSVCTLDNTQQPINNTENITVQGSIMVQGETFKKDDLNFTRDEVAGAEERFPNDPPCASRKSEHFPFFDCKDTSGIFDKKKCEGACVEEPSTVSNDQELECIRNIDPNVKSNSNEGSNFPSVPQPVCALDEKPGNCNALLNASGKEEKALSENSNYLGSAASNVNEKKEDIGETKEKKEEDLPDKCSKKDDKSKKRKFERCNIRDIKLEDELDAVTLSAQKEEQERIKRLQEAQMRALQERLQIIEVEKEALSQLFSNPSAEESDLFDSTTEDAVPAEKDDKAEIPLIKSERDLVLLEAEDTKAKLPEITPEAIESEENIIDISSSSSEGESDSEGDLDKKDDEILVLSDEGDTETAGPDDPNNSGAHTNDCFNLPDHEGRVLVNVGHPPEDPDIYLAPQIAKVIKPHQIGGIRFLYDNVVENLERYKSSSGFGCILAHSMGLGKTVQVVSFVDVFLRHTPATLVLCIVPINTIQNWKAEFDMWVPSSGSVDNEQVVSGEVRPRDYSVYTLNENFKTMAARASLIAEWQTDGGVLLMGYEMYRMLALRKMPKIPVKKCRRMKKQEISPEPETAEQIRKFMDQMYEHIVIPGPDLVICDEGHRIKNSLASTSMALKSIKTRRRVVLTGYPLQNNLLEYWCMVDFVRPNYLGSRAEFCNMFERPISNGQCIDSTPRDRQLMRFRSHVLHSLLVGFVQRRGHSVLRAVLPKKEEHVLLIRMTPIQRQLYKCFVKDLLYVQQATNPLKLFAVCCKIWNHPDILYKLLQEKRAQEDIDLDIDLSTSTTGRLSASGALMRKKAAKDHMKSQVIQKPLKMEPMKVQTNEFDLTEQMQLPGLNHNDRGPSLPTESIPVENNNNDQNGRQVQEKIQMTELTTHMCKEEYPLNSAFHGQHPSQGPGYSHSAMHHDALQSNSYVQSHYSQQDGSFCQSDYSQNARLEQCQPSLPKNSSPYLPAPSLQQVTTHNKYPVQGSSQNSQKQFLNNPVTQNLSSSVPQCPPQSLNSFLQTDGTQNYTQQTSNSQAVSQQYVMQPAMPVEQNYSSQTVLQENFRHQVPQFTSQNATTQYPPQHSAMQQPYSQTFSHQASAPQSQNPFAEESTSQKFKLQEQAKPANTVPFNQQVVSEPLQCNQSTYQAYSQQPVLHSQQFSSAPAIQQQQYGQQLSQKYGEHSKANQSMFPEKHGIHEPYSEQREGESQKSLEQAVSQQQSPYAETNAMQHQFPQHSSITQQQYCQSSQQPYSQCPQPSPQNMSQQFPQSSTLESPSAFSHPSPNSKVHPQSSPQQQYAQQLSPQFQQQSSPVQPFTQCTQSQQQQQFSKRSPPMQQSPTQQQYSLPSPTQPQLYSSSFSQSSPSSHHYLQQQPAHQYPQESSPQQQQYTQAPYNHKSPSQQYPQQSSPQQQFSQTSNQSHSQQYMQNYPRQPSPQHFVQQSQPVFSSHQQQQYSHQPVKQYKSHVTSQNSFSPQTSHSHFPSASQSSNQGQQFESLNSQNGNSLQFNQNTRLSSQQQFSSVKASEQYPVQAAQSKSTQDYNQTNQVASSPQYSQPTANKQYSQSSQQQTCRFTHSPSLLYSQQHYQHSFAQQQNTQTSYKQQLQPPSSMQPLMQIHGSHVQKSPKRMPVKGKTKCTVQSCKHVPQQTCDKNGETLKLQQHSHSTFQNNSADQVTSLPQQSVILTKNVSSVSYQPLKTTLPKKENFVSQNVKDECNAVYPQKGSKAMLRTGQQPMAVSPSTVMLYQQAQKPFIPSHDVLKSEVEQASVPSYESVSTSCRDRIDSSISYEWAIPLMKEYVVGVVENSHKMMVLFAIIDETVQKGDKLLVFSQSLSTLDLLEQFLGKAKVTSSIEEKGSIAVQEEFWCRNKNYFRLDGSTSAQEREKLINEFNRSENVPLFLLSTRAGCLGINLVGANRIVVMDASWNPCHDAQAVCRIYRYGQKKQCHIYRLVTDNSLEKRIYDRQVNKQGMSDRVVDELNPESNFTWKDVTTLIQDDEDDGPSQELSKFEESYTDDVLKFLVVKMSQSLSKEPFEHESLLLDRKDLKLTKQEKRLAKQSYEMAKRANMVNIRTTYTYMPGGGQFIINNKQCQWVGGTTVRVLPGQTVRGATGSNRPGTTATPITASPSLMNSLFKQGVMVQKLTIPSSISIPVLTPGAPPVIVSAGQDVLVLRTPKGVYLRLPDGRIIAVQLPPSLLAKTQFRPNVVTHFRPAASKGSQGSTANASRGQSIGIVKQTLQCGGTVRYLGPKNNTATSSQNVSHGSAPEVIDLSDDDDEPSTKRGPMQNSSEEELLSIDQEKSIPSILQGKQITIRRLSPGSQHNVIQLPSSKDKCDVPLKLQQNQQITIMPINPPSQQNRQKVAPQLAQPVRVQQMLLQPQQGKKKPLSKSLSKISLSSLSFPKNFPRQQITITPAQPVILQKSKSLELPSMQILHKSPENVDDSSQRDVVSPPLALPSSSTLLITNCSKKTESDFVTSEQVESPEIENKESKNISSNVALSVSSSKSSLESVLSGSSSTSHATSSKAALSETSNTSSSIASEMSDQMSSLVPQTSRVSLESHDFAGHSPLFSQNSQVTSNSFFDSHPSLTVSKSLPQISNAKPIEIFSSSALSGCSPQNSAFNALKSQTTVLSNPQLHTVDRKSQPNASQISQSSLLHYASNEVLQPEKSSSKNTELQISSPVLPKLHNSLPEVSSASEVIQTPVFQATESIAKVGACQPELSIPQLQTLPEQVLESTPNGQVHTDASFGHQELPNLHHPSEHLVSFSETQTHQNVRKKKNSSRQRSKNVQPHLNFESNHHSQVSNTHHFSHPSLSDHLPSHHFQPFSHIQNSNFQPFQSYTTHKPLHIQHPQPLHPLQHSQEHSLVTQFPHMSHLYPVTSHLSGTPQQLPNIQSQPWSVPQSSMSSFHPFYQSSQYYGSSHEGSQFSFQPSFALPPPAASHAPQSETNIGVSGLDNTSSACPSDL